MCPVQYWVLVAELYIGSEIRRFELSLVAETLGLAVIGRFLLIGAV